VLAAASLLGCQRANDTVLTGGFAVTDAAAVGGSMAVQAGSSAPRSQSAADIGAAEAMAAFVSERDLPAAVPGDAPSRAQDPDCDFTGIWIADQITVSQALNLPQSSNQWMYLEFKQSGSAVEVTKHFDCGVEVRGSVTVTMSRATTQALIAHNVQNGRKATLSKDGANCEFAVERFWSVRGADEAHFLPNATRDSNDSIEAVDMLKPLPTMNNTDGAVDTENDGRLGVAYQIAGNFSGTRNAVQRYWTRWYSDAEYAIPASDDWTSDLVIRTEFDNEESVLSPKSGLLLSDSMPKFGAKHVLKLRFLGRDSSDPRVAAIVKSTDIDTCYAIQDAMPADKLE
jgi:hypothetical protein